MSRPTPVKRIQVTPGWLISNAGFAAGLEALRMNPDNHIATLSVSVFLGMAIASLVMVFKSARTSMIAIPPAGTEFLFDLYVVITLAAIDWMWAVPLYILSMLGIHYARKMWCFENGF
jgi:hypothetical protein